MIRTVSAPPHVVEIWAEQGQRNAALHQIDHSHIPPLKIADGYEAGRLRGLR
jgi:hypothetical protein